MANKTGGVKIDIVTTYSIDKHGITYRHDRWSDEGKLRQLEDSVSPVLL